MNAKIFRGKDRTLAGLIAAGLICAAACGGAKVKPNPETEVATKMRTAQAYFNAGRTGEALELMREAIAQDPGNPRLHNHYGKYCMLSGRFPDAEAAFEKALEIDPYLTDARNNLGAVLDETGREAEAEQQYRKALEDRAYPTPEKVYLNLGVLYDSQGRQEEALAAMRRAVEINPRYLQAHFNLADLLDRQGKLEEAAREYEVAAPDYRLSGEFHYRLGFVYYRLGDKLAAAEHFRRVIEVSPGSAQAARADEILKTIR
jgi:superkiller protein 3